MEGKKWAQKGWLIVAMALLSLFYIALLSTTKNLYAADLGRHLMNGKIFVEQNLVPKTNFYSYTYPDYLFINHHWGTGVVFYLIYLALGMTGLLWIFIIISVLTFLIFFYLSYQKSSLLIPITISLLALPLLGNRVEIRPETFSYLFIALYFLILHFYQENKLNQKFLLILPALSLLWVNLHIYFIFGLILIAIFWSENLILTLINKKNARKLMTLTGIGTICALLSLLNPNGLQGALYPTQIFQNYGYEVLENKSIFYVENLISYPPAIYLKLLLILVALSWILPIWQFLTKKQKQLNVSLLLITILFSYLALTAIRNMSIFALFAIIIISFNLEHLALLLKKTEIQNKVYIYITVLIIAVGLLFYLNPTYWENKQFFAFNFYPNKADGTDFIKINNLKGPIFNNYDIGGYLIFKLYPQEKVFTDNRPEAYPAEFFEDTYKQMQLDNQKFKQVDEQYQFNIIYFYRLDLTEWAQNFLVQRISDQNWAPVYVDEATIIFLKNNDQNKSVIDKYRLPDSMFNVTKSE